MRETWLFPVFLTLLFWGFWGFFAKVGTKYSPYPSVMVCEWFGSSAVTLAVLLWLGGRMHWGAGGIAFGALAGAMGVLGALAYLAALARTSTPSLVVLATALYPAITLVLNRFFLGESLSGRQWIGFALGAIAVVLMARE